MPQMSFRFPSQFACLASAVKQAFSQGIDVKTKIRNRLMLRAVGCMIERRRSTCARGLLLPEVFEFRNFVFGYVFYMRA